MKNKLEDTLKSKLESNCGFDPFTISIIISVSFQLIKLLWECYSSKKVIQRAAARNGLACRLFLKNHVIPALRDKGLPEEKLDNVAEELRKLVADGILLDEEDDINNLFPG
jgi:hypothetical protein